MGIKERATSILLLLFLMGGVERRAVDLSAELLGVFELPNNAKTRSTLRKLAKEGIIKQSKDSAYQITPAGIDLLALTFPAVRYYFSDWDGVWRVISYEIPENKRKVRDALRRKMSGWGLGPWHRSFWITPHPVLNEFKTLMGTLIPVEYAQAFEATHILGDISVLVDKVWHRQELEKQYKQLFKTWHTILSDEHTQTKKLQLALFAYVNVLKDDPGLPKELLGEGWVGYESMTIFQDIRTILYATS